MVAIVAGLTAALLIGAADGSVSLSSTAMRWQSGTHSPPPCSARTAAAPRLRESPTMLSVPTEPFGVAVTASGRFIFAGLSNSVGVFVWRGGHLHLRTKITVPEEALGVALTPDGRYLLSADGYGGAYVLNVAAAERGSRSAVLGQLTSAGSGAIEVGVSPDGKYAFVSLETSNELAVFNLRRAIDTGFTRYMPIGVVPLGEDPVGMATSADGRYLYVTSEVTPPSHQGSLSTIDLATAETDPARAVVSSVPAGCSPVRVAIARGSVYVTARASDAVLWFSSRALVHDPADALRGTVRVGSAPVGLAVVGRSSELLVADSDRFGSAPRANLALLRLGPHGRAVLAGYLDSGGFPRDIAATRHGNLVVIANYASSQLETLELGSWRR